MLRVHEPDLIDRLEARDCRCCDSSDPQVILAHGPCRHVLAADHGMSLDDWAELQRLTDPVGYDEPPDPPEPKQAVSRKARVELMRQRAQHLDEDGKPAPYGLRHPEDVDAEKLDALSLGSSRCRNGPAVFGALRLSRRAA